MSQLDISITFSHFCGLVLFLYVFLYYMVTLLIKFWYNKKLRSLDNENLRQELNKLDNNLIIKKILKL